jgi:hypothetical protein
VDTDDFYLRIAHALSGCQLVEQELKLYIAEALELIQKRVGDKLPFSMSGKDYADAPLGHLIKVFPEAQRLRIAIHDEANKFVVIYGSTTRRQQANSRKVSCYMKTRAALLAMAVLAAASATAQTPFTKCPVPSSVSNELPKLEMDIVLGLAKLSDEWRKQLRSAAHADTTACLAVENAMYDWVNEGVRLREEILRVREEINLLKHENALFKNRVGRSK